jgi:hypothetical protein
VPFSALPYSEGESTMILRKSRIKCKKTQRKILEARISLVYLPSRSCFQIVRYCGITFVKVASLNNLSVNTERHYVHFIGICPGRSSDWWAQPLICAVETVKKSPYKHQAFLDSLLQLQSHERKGV